MPPIGCPVPGCGQLFPYMNDLLRHFQCVNRRNRCGAYTGAVFFPCVCGDICVDLAMIKAHAVHTQRPVLRMVIPSLYLFAHILQLTILLEGKRIACWGGKQLATKLSSPLVTYLLLSKLQLQIRSPLDELREVEWLCCLSWTSLTS